MPHTEVPPEVPPAAPSGELSLADIIAHRSSVLWHEAVGVVLGVAEIAAAADPPAVPPVEAVVLVPDGSIRIEPHSPIGTGPVTQLRGWLNDLLQETPAPPPLVDLAQDGESSAGTLDAFVEALRYFSRPNRREELAALARRINAERHVAFIDQELAALTAKVSQPKPADASTARRKAIPSLWNLVAALGRSRLAGIAAVGAMAALAFPVVAWRTWSKPAPLPVTRAWSTPIEAPSLQAASIPRAARPVPPSVEFHRRAAVAPRRAETQSRRRANAPDSPPVVPASALPSDLSTAAVPHAVPVELSFAYPTSLGGDASVESAAPTPSATPAPSRVFTPDDLDVVQPVLLSSSLSVPGVPGASPGGVTVIDLLIDEQGRVDRATLVSPAVRFEERMLLSAVKAWRFRPATRDGVPVRYRARVSLTL